MTQNCRTRATKPEIRTSNGTRLISSRNILRIGLITMPGAPTGFYVPSFGWRVGGLGRRTAYQSNSFGARIAASANGDLPGVIYRLIGGV